MKVAHIVGSLEARYGGPSRSVRQLAAATAAIGHTVDILTSAPAAVPVETVGRLSIRTWRRGWPSALCLVPGLAAHLKSTSYDIVHHHGLWLRTLHYAHRKAAGNRLPLVVSPRGMMSTWAWGQHRLRKSLAARWVHPGALAAVSGWHATSPEEAGEIRRLGYEQPVCVSPNGVDVSNAADVIVARQHWQALVPASATMPVALFYSRFHHKKRIIELIDLWVTISPPNWRLLIVGVPEQFSVAQLRAYVLRSGMAGRIEVYDGAEHPRPYAIASLFLLPSHNENFGLVVAEASAQGVPVVVTDTTPWSAIQRNGMGWCVPWYQYGTALRAALDESPAGLQERGARAREWILREFSWRKAAEELAAFYASLKGVSA